MKKRLAGALPLGAALLAGALSPDVALALPKPQEGAAAPVATPPARSPVEVGAWIAFFVLGAAAVIFWWVTSRRKRGGGGGPQA
jgi:hypothetical protein